MKRYFSLRLSIGLCLSFTQLIQATNTNKEADIAANLAAVRSSQAIVAITNNTLPKDHLSNIPLITEYLFEKTADSKGIKQTKLISSFIIAGLSTVALQEIFTNDLMIRTFFTDGNPATFDTLGAFMYIGMFLPENITLLNALNIQKKTAAAKLVAKSHFSADMGWLSVRSILSALLTIKTYKVFYNATFGLTLEGQSMGGIEEYIIGGPYLLVQFLKANGALTNDAISLLSFRHKFFPKKKTHADLKRKDLKEKFKAASRKILSLSAQDLQIFKDTMNHSISDNLNHNDLDALREHALRALYNFDSENKYLCQPEPLGHKVARVTGAVMPFVFTPLYWLTSYGAATDVQDPEFNDTLGNLYAAPMLVYTAAVTSYLTHKIAGNLWCHYTGKHPNLWQHDFVDTQTSLPITRAIVASLSYGFSGLVSVPVAGLGAAKVAYATLAAGIDGQTCKKITEACLVGAGGYASLAFNDINSSYQSMVDFVAHTFDLDPVGRLRDHFLKEIGNILTHIDNLQDESVENLHAYLEGAQDDGMQTEAQEDEDLPPSPPSSLSKRLESNLEASFVEQSSPTHSRASSSNNGSPTSSEGSFANSSDSAISFSDASFANTSVPLDDNIALNDLTERLLPQNVGGVTGKVSFKEKVKNRYNRAKEWFFPPLHKPGQIFEI